MSRPAPMCLLMTHLLRGRNDTPELFPPENAGSRSNHEKTSNPKSLIPKMSRSQKTRKVRATDQVKDNEQDMTTEWNPRTFVASWTRIFFS